MPELLTQLPCTAFIQALASRDPVPGGGGASAITGALGAALCSMAGSLSAGRKSLEASREELEQLLVQCQRIQIRLLELVEEDAVAFTPLSRAYSIPKDDPARDEIMEPALLKAAEAPLEIMRKCAEALELISGYAAKGSALAISDAGCAAALCGAAMESAALNVKINTKSMKNRAVADSINAEMNELLQKYFALSQEIYNDVSGRLS